MSCIVSFGAYTFLESDNSYYVKYNIGKFNIFCSVA